MKKKLMFSVRCYYSELNSDSYDINKLFGFSHGLHHQNSVRFGWKPDFQIENKIEIWSYVYNRGIRNFTKICSVNCKEIINYSISIENSMVNFTVSSETGNIISNFSIDYTIPLVKIGYHLFPYFGGNNKAPRRMDILFFD